MLRGEERERSKDDAELVDKYEFFLAYKDEFYKHLLKKAVSKAELDTYAYKPNGYNPSNPKYVVAISTSNGTGSYPVALALDCEMCATSLGDEVTRVTVVDQKCSVVYDSLVWTEAPIIDYKTNKSGITEEMLLNGPTKQLSEVHDDLLNLIKSDTILIGHGVDNDLRVLKMHHDLLVDTSVEFRDTTEVSFVKRRSLKHLAYEYLHKVIQNSEGGHDSAEDAKTCIELLKVQFQIDALNRQRASSSISGPVRQRAMNTYAAVLLNGCSKRSERIN
ncbi:Hypothetical predicted protein [Cloeon dipterum]|uniref:Exonuclease domain-containing protein n=1 Tax=Cloeon dipterum TaxID=197152 RepID=A0A8S1CY89_9INSE|nr:Hypothetical predicted protein [Cloeon dipterum]